MNQNELTLSIFIVLVIFLLAIMGMTTLIDILEKKKLHRIEVILAMIITASLTSLLLVSIYLIKTL